MTSPILPARGHAVSVLPPHRPPPTPAARGPCAAAARRAAAGAPGWGWLEWFVLAQTVLPALCSCPGSRRSARRSRVAAYVVAPLAWVLVAWRGRAAGRGRSFPARPWLVFCTAWLVLSILHPNTYSLLAAAAQAALYIAVFSPAFWAPAALDVEPADPPADGDPVPLQRAERAGGGRPGLPARGLQPAGHPAMHEHLRGRGPDVRDGRRPEDPPPLRPDRHAGGGRAGGGGGGPDRALLGLAADRRLEAAGEPRPGVPRGGGRSITPRSGRRS